MTNDKGIFIKNIYYMLSYAFQELRQNNYADIKGETFENVYDLFAEIIARGVSSQLKQGLHKEYVAHHEISTTFRGKLDISGTIQEYSAQRHRLVCEYDEFSINSIFNRILKSVMTLLIKHSCVCNERKIKLRKIMYYFTEVDEVNLYQIVWKNLRFDRNTRNYQMLMCLCYFIFEEILLSTDDGNVHMPMFSDERMCRLYEKFILEYYKRHHPLLKASAKQIGWNINADLSTINILPIMQSDICLSKSGKTLIIDAKYYEKSMQTNFNKVSIHNDNLYQIYSYVNNEDIKHIGNVNGMLLYAKTSESITSDGCIVTNDGNKISFKTLDLNCDFTIICEQLDRIVMEHFD